MFSEKIGGTFSLLSKYQFIPLITLSKYLVNFGLINILNGIQDKILGTPLKK